MSFIDYWFQKGLGQSQAQINRFQKEASVLMSTLIKERDFLAQELADFRLRILGKLYTSVLSAGSAMYPFPDLNQNQANGVISSNGVFRLVMQRNGDLVLYMVVDGNHMPIWSSHTAGLAVQGCFMQHNGNLVLCALDGSVLWNSSTAQHPGSHLEVQDDGNMVIYDASHTPIWATGTDICTGLSVRN